MEKPELCEAGRRCGLGGKWRIPCNNLAVHAIANPAMPPILLCDQHFQEVQRLGLVRDENIGQEEFDRREQERKKSR